MTSRHINNGRKMRISSAFCAFNKYRRVLCLVLIGSGLGLALVLAGSPDDRQFNIASWAQLEKLLRETDFDLTALETMERCEEFARLLESASAGIFEEMATQARYPLVKVAGFYGMQKRFPSWAWRTALVIVLRSEHSASVLNGPMLLEINKQRDAAAFQRMMEWLVAMPVAQADGLVMAMGALDGESLYRWYHMPPSDVGSASMEATILDRLVEACQQLGREPSQLMRKRFRAVGAVPGRSRFTYVMDAKIMGVQINEPEFARALISVMEDPDLKPISVSLLCHQHFDYIESNVDLESLVVGDERKQVIKEALDTTRRLRQSRDSGE